MSHKHKASWIFQRQVAIERRNRAKAERGSLVAVMGFRRTSPPHDFWIDVMFMMGVLGNVSAKIDNRDGPWTYVWGAPETMP